MENTIIGFIFEIIIDNLYIFLLISPINIFIINGLRLTSILKIIWHCDVKHIMMLPIKTMTAVMNVLTYIITSVTALPTRLPVILAMISVPTFVTSVILYLFSQIHVYNIILIDWPKCYLETFQHLYVLQHM
jgi:hypothetical protein